MFTRKIEILIVGLAFAGKNCGATEVAVSPGDPQLAIAPRNRIKESDAVKMPPPKKEKTDMPNGSKKALPKEGKPGMPKGKNQNSPSLGKTIDEIIHAISGENGMMYAMSKEEIFNGSAAEKVHPQLAQLVEKVKMNINRYDLNDLNRLDQVLMNKIRGLYKTILYAYDELPDYTQQEIERYRFYYITIKNQLESLANAISGRLMEIDND